MTICIANGLVIDPATKLQQIGDVWIEDGIITEITFGDTRKQSSCPSIDADKKSIESTTYIDAKGNWVVPGLIDLHVHFREPGYEYKEDIASGCRAAAKGGFTTVCCMPNTNPPIDNAETVSCIYEKAGMANGVHVLPVGAITKGQEGKELADYQGMLDKGISAISEDGKTVTDPDLMARGMNEASKLSLPVFSHAEPEEAIVARDINLSKETGCRLHFCHISTEESLTLIRKAKEEGLKITAETAPHYFTLDESQVNGDPNKKMNPPLRKQSDVQAVLNALKDGTLDVIATDHAPHHEKEKSCPYNEAANGVTGLETSFAISYTELVKTGRLTPLELIEKMSSRPAEILNIDRGTLMPGKAADIAIINVDTEYVIKAEDFVSKASNSPFIGMKVFGKTEYTIVDGKIIWKRD